jgi:hypothetical protein
VNALKNRQNFGRTMIGLGCVSTYYFKYVSYSFGLFLGSAFTTSLFLMAVLSIELTSGIYVVDIMLMPSGTDVRLTFANGRSFLVPINQIRMDKIYDRRNALKMRCMLMGREIGVGVNYEEVKDGFMDPVLMLALLSPNVQTIKWAQ